MTPTLLYLIGLPGAGKTSAMAALTEGTLPCPVRAAPGLAVTEHHWRGQPVAAQLGRIRAAFAGTDALPFNVLPAAVAWMAQAPASYPLLLGEGDRLAHPRLWQAAREAGYRVIVAHLDVDPDEARRRRTARGTNQNGAWVRGRATRVANLTRLQAWPVVTVPADRPVEQVAAHLARLLPAAPWRRAAA